MTQRHLEEAGFIPICERDESQEPISLEEILDTEKFFNSEDDDDWEFIDLDDDEPDDEEEIDTEVLSVWDGSWISDLGGES